MKLALIAHDGKKADMVAFVMKRMDFFKRKEVSLVGTGTTGTIPVAAATTCVRLGTR